MVLSVIVIPRNLVTKSVIMCVNLINLVCNDKDKMEPYLERIYEPRHEKTGFLPMRKQRRRSASAPLFLLHG